MRWADKLGVPDHVRSENEYAEMLKRQTFEEIEIHHVPDESPTPDDYKGSGFSNAQEVREFKRTGALLLVARKPNVLTPRSGVEIY